MKLLTALIIGSTAAVVAATKGCGPTLSANIDAHNTKQYTIDSTGRTFLVHLPASYKPDQPTKVYFSFHGATKNAAEQEGLSGLSDPYFNPDSIAVYPQADGDYWLSNPNVDPDQSPTDIDFVLDILSWLDTNLCIDTKRRYASGKSNGGGLANLLACDSRTAAKFAAFAGVSGAYYKDDLATNCNPGRVIPFISFHGTDDTTIPYDGKKGDDRDHSTYAIDTWLKQWIKRNGIASSVKSTNSTPFDLVQEAQWSRDGYPNVVTHYKESKLGHVWPSTLPNDDCPAPSTPKCPMGHYTFNGTTVIVDYFKHWSL